MTISGLRETLLDSFYASDNKSVLGFDFRHHGKMGSSTNYSSAFYPINVKRIATVTKNVKNEKDQGFLYDGHYDLKSFLALKDVNTNSSIYRGTLYEYQTMSCLKTTLGIVTRRVGKANDGGIDFRGQWILPDKKLYVVGQCKALAKKCPPNIIRELEGVLCQETEGTLCILSSMNGFTKSAIKRYIASPFPIMLIAVTDHGKKYSCILWNKTAEKYLNEFQVTLKHDLLNSKPLILYNGKPFLNENDD
ncbi:25836_t:CDS:2 [Dentiscutata erythropus]|uniref:25836_t:CDS:1 n=1 Tax=Dentiscutata erythropus TaxID=1348616 RepID=A0A9N8YYI7_9GLOM|nr:25836_t:CDS:2 [Dentiscutata erythropus]